MDCDHYMVTMDYGHLQLYSIMVIIFLETVCHHTMSKEKSLVQ